MSFINQCKHLFQHYRLLLVLTAIALGGCQPGTSQPNQPETHRLTGVVTSIDKEHKLLVVKHDAIPGKMEAMTMPFSPADPGILDTLHKGDKISADMSIEGNGAVLNNIEVIKE